MQTLVTLAPLIVGLASAISAGFLPWLAQHLKARKEARDVIGAALSDLLEIRHRITTIDSVCSEIRKQHLVSDAQFPVVRQLMDQLFGADTQLGPRYDNAVSILSRTNPILAFGLRSQNLLSTFFQQWRTLGINTGADLAQIEALERQVKELVIPRLNDAAIDLAAHHSRKLKREVMNLIQKTSAIPPEIQVLVAQLKSQPTSAKPSDK
jgi:hypothetical protein